MLINRQALKLYPNVKEAIFFGSRTIGSHHQGSVSDIALKGDELKETVLNQPRSAMHEIALSTSKELT